MSIMWQYLDKRSAAVSAIKDFDNMQFIIDHTDEDINRIRAEMTGIRSPGYDGMPKSHNPQAGEECLLSSIEKIDLLKERYRQAQEYMDWFLPAWKELPEEDQFVLEAFYRDNEYGCNAADAVSRRLCIERASAYRRKNRAVEKLTIMLYGKF